MTYKIQQISLKAPCYLIETGSVFLMIDIGDSSDCGGLEKALENAGVSLGNLIPRLAVLIEQAAQDLRLGLSGAKASSAPRY